jgi:hypothetical protein
MSKRRELRVALVMVIVFTTLLAACATPPAVRSLSEEQLKAHESYLKSQQQYFAVIEHFVESQIAVTETLVAASTSRLNAIYREKAQKAVDPADAQKTKKALADLETNVLKEQKADQEGLARIKDYYAQLREFHKNMLKALATIVAAQTKLNEYIQLQKADEVAVSQLLATVGIEKDKVERAAESAATIYQEIEKYIEGGASK